MLEWNKKYQYKLMVLMQMHYDGCENIGVCVCMDQHTRICFLCPVEMPRRSSDVPVAVSIPSAQILASSFSFSTEGTRAHKRTDLIPEPDYRKSRMILELPENKDVLKKRWDTSKGYKNEPERAFHIQSWNEITLVLHYYQQNKTSISPYWDVYKQTNGRQVEGTNCK